MAGPNLFATAEPTRPAKASAKQDNVWKVEDPTVAEAITVINTLGTEAKAIERRLEEKRAVVKAFAEDHWLRELALEGASDSPRRLVNKKGHSVTFVVQDRSATASLSDDQLHAIADGALDEDVSADELVEVSRVYSFNPTILAEINASGRSVQDTVFQAVSDALVTLHKKKVLTESQLRGLIRYEERTVLKPTVLGKLPEICGRSVERMKAFLAAIGSASVRFIRA